MLFADAYIQRGILLSLLNARGKPAAQLWTTTQLAHGNRRGKRCGLGAPRQDLWRRAIIRLEHGDIGSGETHFSGLQNCLNLERRTQPQRRSSTATKDFIIKN